MKPKSINLISLTTLTIFTLMFVVPGTNGGQKNDVTSFPFLRTELIEGHDLRGTNGQQDIHTCIKRLLLAL